MRTGRTATATAVPERPPAQRVTRGAAAGYAAGDLGISIAYFAVGFFFLFYLTDLVGLSPAVAGTVVLIGKLWDGVNDPLIGILVDRTRSRHGRKRAYLLYGAVPFALSFIALWWLPAGSASTATAVVATLLSLLFATTYSLVGVPYQALVPVMTADYDERTRLVAYKAVASAIGVIIGGGIALVVTSQAGVEQALRIMAIGFGIAIAVTILVAATSTRAHARFDSVPITPVPLQRYLQLLLEPNVAVLMGYKVLGAVATGVLTASLPYVATHVVGSGSASTYALAAYTITAAALVPLWSRWSHRIDKRRLILVSNVCAAGVLLAVGLLAGAGSTVLFIAGAALLGTVMSAYLVLPPSLVPDLVDHYEYETGERHEAVFFGLWMTVHQLGLGVAGFVLGLFLTGFGYEAAAEVQDATAVLGVRLAFAIIPGTFLVLAALLLLRYRITRDTLVEAQVALAARNGSGPEAGPVDPAPGAGSPR
jgi:glycoside/pentoside/hexuronide:cation symporter, GPH family